ncbi:hypothetical protein D4764_12G0010660 [Takifugu flavidus]|uniref:Uncharacterized protein n=1 Tax=Takifugu flavidus TaxID=433684 RepID=A0A5C6PEW6_9TELE|nr:hypothetical protein D4764_12G0010660 [Takifugu flavidus]
MQLPIRSCVEESRCYLWTCTRSLSSFYEEDCLFQSMMVFGSANGQGYVLSHCFEYLVVVPAIATISHGLWAAAEKMFQRASSGAKGTGSGPAQSLWVAGSGSGTSSSEVRAGWRSLNQVSRQEPETLKQKS